MTLKMIFEILILCWTLFIDAHGGQHMKPMSEGECLTGYMTDVQTWVDAGGSLNKKYVDQRYAIDMSYTKDPVPGLLNQFNVMRFDSKVEYLSMAKCGLSRVPLIFQLVDHSGRILSDTIQYMSFYGNQFVDVNSSGEDYDVFFNATDAVQTDVSSTSRDGSILIWSSGLQRTEFPLLKELDLRGCFIQFLSPRVFQGMRNLRALYIGENSISIIKSKAFVGLNNLLHLDISRNHPYDNEDSPTFLSMESFDVFNDLTNLMTLDLSHTKMIPRNFGTVERLGRNLTRLSLCNTGLLTLSSQLISETNLRILDLSRNNGLFTGPQILKGLENKLQVLNANDVGLLSMENFKDFINLEILQLSNNEISIIDRSSIINLKNLKILDLNKNRLTSWFKQKFSLMPKLRFLSLRDNNINMITEQMIEDLKLIDYVALSGNSLVCNCHAKDLYQMVGINEMKVNDTLIKPKWGMSTQIKPFYNTSLHHTGFDYYNKIITNRKTVEYDNETYINPEESGIFRLVDYWPETYTCLRSNDFKSVQFFEVPSCIASTRNQGLEDELNSGRRQLLMLLLIPCLFMPMLFIFVFRRNLKYCLITMRNSAMLSLINKNEVIEDNTIFNYDVFVSYCNEDRGWVLDHLLPHMESECTISACLHERDFQVGLSILENIVNCMDRSRAIMLIISQQFLLSQWCQFEMHLAQHRLLETRREDLILVLLEDIPRRMRPNTLHYLMMTKTYIVWPKVKPERIIFWRRLNKSLMSQKTRQNENASLA